MDPYEKIKEEVIEALSACDHEVFSQVMVDGNGGWIWGLLKPVYSKKSKEWALPDDGRWQHIGNTVTVVDDYSKCYWNVSDLPL